MKHVLVALICLTAALAYSQTDSSQFDLDLEFRPRFEFRHGYGELPDESQSAAAFVSNRTRLLMTYERPKFRFHTSVQDIRIWGQNGQFSTGGLGIFEAYVEPSLGKHSFLRIGRQSVDLDNKRLFSQSNWNQTSRAHEGINFVYSKGNIHSELMTFYDQTSSALYGITAVPNNYLTLSVHYLTWQPSSDIKFMVLNVLDSYQHPDTPNFVYARGTSGGRATWNKKGFNATVAAYYQYGQIQSGKQVSAYYIQPEIGFKNKRWNFRAGMEYVSGDHAAPSKPNSTQSFETLYGVTYRFMGNMNQFIHFPEDVSGMGLVNPYFFTHLNITEDIKLKLENHAFLTQQHPGDFGYTSTSTFLGAEADLKLRYHINDYTELEGGFSILYATNTFAEMRNVTLTDVPVWSFLMVTFHPNLMHLKQPVKQRNRCKTTTN